MLRILLVLLFFCSLGVNAQDYTQYCSSNSAQKKIAGHISSLSGFNTLTRKVIEYEIKKEFKKQTKADIALNIDSFYGTSMLDGEFKSLKGNAQNIEFGGLYFSKLEFNSLCNYNKIGYKNDSLIFDENFVLGFKTNINQDDLNKYITSGKYQKVISKLNNNQTISSLFKIENSKIQILENKLLFRYRVIPFPNSNLDFLSAFIRPITITFTSNLRINDDKIELFDFEINNSRISVDYFLPFMNLSNPTVFDVDIDKNNKGKINIQNINIENKNILMDGMLFIPKTKN